jgi:hypothetical protein
LWSEVGSSQTQKILFENQTKEYRVGGVTQVSGRILVQQAQDYELKPHCKERERGREGGREKGREKKEKGRKEGGRDRGRKGGRGKEREREKKERKKERKKEKEKSPKECLWMFLKTSIKSCRSS